MRQCEANHSTNILNRDLLPALQRNIRSCRPVGDQVTAEAVHIAAGADLADHQLDLIGSSHLRQQLTGRLKLCAQCFLLLLALLIVLDGVLIVRDAVQHQLCPLLNVKQSAHADLEAKAVQQLRPHLTLLWVAAAHHDELGGMDKADTLTLNSVDASGCGVQDHIHETVVQKVDLINVQDAAVGSSQKARLIGLLALHQCLLNVNGAADAVLSGAQRELHQRHLLLDAGQRLPSLVGLQALRSHQRGVSWGGVERVVRNCVHLR
mmetsp:Transcript_17216/g.44686  ORF Transcript_17216/g.44686 Transcript_17216/m.44686 type:complete len:264 (+) Transcript_17216:274-1065(+)